MAQTRIICKTYYTRFFACKNWLVLERVQLWNYFIIIPIINSIYKLFQFICVSDTHFTGCYVL